MAEPFKWVKNQVSKVVKNAKGDDYTGKAGIPQEASKGMAKQDKRDAQYAATHQGEVASGKTTKDGKTGSNPSGKVDLKQIATNIADTVDTAKKSYETGKTMTEVEKDKKAKKKEQEAAPANTSQTSSTPANVPANNAPAPQDTGNGNIADPEAPDYNLGAKKALEANGLDKYVKEDGSIDYKKLEKSKVGWKVLQGLGSAMASFASGMTGHNFDASNGFASQEIAKRQEVQDAYKDTAEDEMNDQRDMETFTKKMNLNHKERLAFQDSLNALNRSDRQAILNSIYAQPLEKQQMAAKVLAQSPENPMEALASIGIGFADKVSGGAISGLRSDEKCKSFAKRSVFK